MSDLVAAARAAADQARVASTVPPEHQTISQLDSGVRDKQVRCDSALVTLWADGTGIGLDEEFDLFDTGAGEVAAATVGDKLKPGANEDSGFDQYRQVPVPRPEPLTRGAGLPPVCTWWQLPRLYFLWWLQAEHAKQGGVIR